MSTITVSTACGTTREFDSRRDAEEGKATHRSLCEECGEDDIDVTVTPDPEQSTLRSSGGAGGSGEPVAGGSRRPAPGSAAESAPTEAGVPAEMPDTVGTDPLDVVPSYMITEVEGQPTINKRGYAVIAHHFDIVVRSEAITTAGETDHQYAEFRATAYEREAGPEHGYTGHGTARASEDRSGIENNLNEMAETRAMKRAVAWASGVGVLAWEEMVEYLDEE